LIKGLKEFKIKEI